MSIKHTLKPILVPIHREGYKFIAAFAVVSLLLLAISCFLGIIGFLLTAWCVYFFRDPERVAPVQADYIISPADGLIQAIGEASPPPELGLGNVVMTRISIFMSPFNVHINRAPLAGVVTKISYRAGKFLNASLDKASDDNERNSLIIKTAGNREIIVTQIAGLIARRIVTWVTEGQEMASAERFGMIRFGSRVDIYLPEGATVNVLPGQTSIGGETILAEMPYTAIV